MQQEATGVRGGMILQYAAVKVLLIEAMSIMVRARTRRATDVLSACEGLDDEHRGAAVSAHEGGPGAVVIGAAVARVNGRRWRGLKQKSASGGDVALTVGVGEQSIVTDAVKARGQHVQQEATHELLGGHGHGFIASAPVLTIVLPAERDAAIVTSDEPRVCDRDPMGVAGQIGENLLRSCEGALGVDDPLTLTQRHEPVGEGIGISQIEVLAEELQLTIKMEVHKLFKEAAPEKTRQHPDREEEPRLARHPAVGIRCEAAAGHDAMHVRMMRQGRAPGVQHQGLPIRAPKCFGSAAIVRSVSAAMSNRSP